MTLDDIDGIYDKQRQARIDELFCMMATPNCDQDFGLCYEGCRIDDDADITCLGFVIDDDNSEMILDACGVGACWPLNPGQCQDACLETCPDLPCLEICWIACTDVFFDCLYTEWP